MRAYFIVDVGEEGPDGQAEGVVLLVGEAHREDVPGRCVRYHLVLYALGLVHFAFGLWLH